MWRDLRVHIWVTQTGGLREILVFLITGYPVAEVEHRRGKRGRKEERKKL
jgi:hypothetical protein